MAGRSAVHAPTAGGLVVSTRSTVRIDAVIFDADGALLDVDAFGAHAFEFHVFWVNRPGQPAEYGPHDVATKANDFAASPGALGMTASRVSE